MRSNHVSVGIMYCTIVGYGTLITDQHTISVFGPTNIQFPGAALLEIISYLPAPNNHSLPLLLLRAHNDSLRALQSYSV